MARKQATLDYKAKENITRQTWRERIISSGKKDPLVCPHCDNYYEYKGEVCLENGKLEIKVALIDEARQYLEKVVAYGTPIKESQKGKKETKGNRPLTTTEDLRQLSLFDVS